MAARKRPKQPPEIAHPENPRERLIAAALSLAASRAGGGWAWPKSPRRPDCRSRRPMLSPAPSTRILAALRRQIDEAMLAGGVVGGDSSRDRLFDVLMRRLEAMRPYRAGLRAILRDSVGSPALLRMLPGLLRSMGWTLTAAGLPASGFRGRLARRVVGAIYVSLLPRFSATRAATRRYDGGAR